MSIKVCPNCLSKVGSEEIDAVICPYCKSTLSASIQSTQRTEVKSQSVMVLTLKVLAWTFVCAGIIAGIAIYPSDPHSPGFTLESYGLAKAISPAQKTLAWQTVISGVVAGVFTGALGCILETLHEIRDRSKS